MAPHGEEGPRVTDFEQPATQHHPDLGAVLRGDAKIGSDNGLGRAGVARQI